MQADRNDSLLTSININADLHLQNNEEFDRICELLFTWTIEAGSDNRCSSINYTISKAVKVIAIIQLDAECNLLLINMCGVSKLGCFRFLPIVRDLSLNSNSMPL